MLQIRFRFRQIFAIVSNVLKTSDKAYYKLKSIYNETCKKIISLIKLMVFDSTLQILMQKLSSAVVDFLYQIFVFLDFLRIS